MATRQAQRRGTSEEHDRLKRDRCWSVGERKRGELYSAARVCSQSYTINWILSAQYIIDHSSDPWATFPLSFFFFVSRPHPLTLFSSLSSLFLFSLLVYSFHSRLPSLPTHTQQLLPHFLLSTHHHRLDPSLPFLQFPTSP